MKHVPYLGGISILQNEISKKKQETQTGWVESVSRNKIVALH